MDVFPEFCDSCTVETGEDWQCCRDPLTALHLINVRFVVRWPINIVIRTEHLDMYYEIFEFNLKIKWALHTLGHLLFNGEFLGEKWGCLSENLTDLRNLNV